MHVGQKRKEKHLSQINDLHDRIKENHIIYLNMKNSIIIINQIV